MEWAQTDSLYPVSIQVEAWDRVGLMRDITTVVAEEKINIDSVNLVNQYDSATSIFLTVETEGLAQLSRLLKKMETVRGVTNIHRVTG